MNFYALRLGLFSQFGYVLYFEEEGYMKEPIRFFFIFSATFRLGFNLNIRLDHILI